MPAARIVTFQLRLAAVSIPWTSFSADAMVATYRILVSSLKSVLGFPRVSYSGSWE